MIRILLSTRLGERKWTQADLARKTGIRPSTINELYHEIVERVNLDHLDLIIRVPNQTPRIDHTRSGSPVQKNGK